MNSIEDIETLQVVQTDCFSLFLPLSEYDLIYEYVMDPGIGYLSLCHLSWSELPHSVQHNHQLGWSSKRLFFFSSPRLLINKVKRSSYRSTIFLVDVLMNNIGFSFLFQSNQVFKINIVCFSFSVIHEFISLIILCDIRTIFRSNYRKYHLQ